jgi:beta-mannanase
VQTDALGDLLQPRVDPASMGPLRDYWPGAAYVNWIGIDGYYYGP